MSAIPTPAQAAPDAGVPPAGAPLYQRQHAAGWPMDRTLWTGLGLVALALGAAGAVLPLLPSTPFILLAAFAFGRGSPRLRRWIAAHPRFGPPIRDWEAHGAVARPLKRLAVIVMAATFAIGLAAGLPPLALAVQAVCLAGAGTYVLTRPDGPPAT
jgi:uncharacterized membrane protein YbaN (DUF454 family)